MKIWGDRTILLNCETLRPTDLEAARKSLRAAPGRVAVHMQPSPRGKNGILIANARRTDYSLRPDVGQVIAVGEGVPLEVGQYVVIDHRYGKHYEGFKCGSYAAAYEVRVYGSVRIAGSTSAAVSPWHNAIIGVANTMKYRVIQHEDGQELFVHKWINSNRYVCYAYHLNNGDVLVPRRGRPPVRAKIPAGKTVKLLVDCNPINDDVSIHVETLSNDYLTEVDELDMNLPFRACWDRVLVELDELHDQSEGGIIFAESDKFRSTWATVLSCGSRVPPEIQPGCRVLVSPGGMERCHWVQDLELSKRALRTVEHPFIDIYENPEEQAA